MAYCRDLQPVTTTFLLNTGNSMPAVALGSYRLINEEKVIEVIDAALAAGYRLFDTAAIHNYETLLKKAFQKLLPKYKLERADIFVTIKISPSLHSKDAAIKKGCEQSLETLGMDYIDLYLIQFPVIAKLPIDDEKNIEIQNIMWSSLVDLYDAGLVNAIGVYNSSISQLTQMLKYNHNVIPAVNQVEWNPLNYNSSLLKFCKQHDIVLQAHSSMGGTMSDMLLNHERLTKFAKELEVSNGQILLAWALQQDVAVVPKSVKPEHIRENILLNFTLPNHIKRVLNDISEQNTSYAWTLNTVRPYSYSTKR